MFKILADKAIPFTEFYFSSIAEVTRVAASEITNQRCESFDGLLIRSVTQVDESLLSNTAIKWVGTATIGIEHLDLNWLKSNFIQWHSAPGCNALAVVQYVLSALAVWSEQSAKPFESITAGIVGLGEVGSRLKRALDYLSVNTRYCDPFVNSGDGSIALTQLLDECDVVTLHVPLTKNGSAPTYYLMDERAFEHLASDKLLINAARGDVIQGKALTSWLEKGGQAILDVWPNEPNISNQLLNKVLVGTPHIAGYSIEGKLNATTQLFHRLTEFLNIENNGFESSPLSESEWIESDSKSLTDLLLASYNILDDHKQLIVSDINAERFSSLRNNYMFRHDYSGQKTKNDHWAADLQYLSSLK
ncbi:MAG: 4-phosphoerythronate dehydrogenase [Gammaproteobacteria bacterium]|nr:4-phosphoerythronate dehydrogenase [Gammaproteobacteria bacterium]